MGKISLRESLAPPPRIARINVDQYHRMLETGILKDGDPIELLDGVLVYKDRGGQGEDAMTVGKKHRMTVLRLMDLASAIRNYGAHLYLQNPITLAPDHEPEPDGCIVRGSPEEYADRHPGASDLWSVIEVSDSSLAYDRTAKLRVFAASGILQYVLLNLVDLQVEVYELPIPREGRYERSTILKMGSSVPFLVGQEKRLEVPVDKLIY